ncbi:hypothetical protein V8G54_014001, partial [Vigna mungo]
MLFLVTSNLRSRLLLSLNVMSLKLESRGKYLEAVAVLRTLYCWCGVNTTRTQGGTHTHFIPTPPHPSGYKEASPFCILHCITSSYSFHTLQQVEVLKTVCHSKMSYGHYHMGSGSRTGRRSLEFGKTHVMRPKGKHQATIVWLHGLGDNGLSSYQLLESLPLPNIKWICPTAPTRPVTILGGFSCTAWFDMGELSEDDPDDWESLDASAAHIANLLLTEPADDSFILTRNGFFFCHSESWNWRLQYGCCSSSILCNLFCHGKVWKWHPYPVNLRAVVGLSGWLPGS